MYEKLEINIQTLTKLVYKTYTALLGKYFKDKTLHHFIVTSVVNAK